MYIRISKQGAVGDKLPSYNFEPGNCNTGNGDWSNCTRCRLYHTRNRVAIKRGGGTGRTRLLFIGEAPGSLEDKTGLPFVGLSGRILQRVLDEVHYHQFSYLITNLVGCRPVSINFLDAAVERKLNDPDFSLKNYTQEEDYELYEWNRDPSSGEIEQCKGHIDELIDNFMPHGIVYLGKVAKSYKTQLPSLELLHPAYIGRMEYKLLTVRREGRKLDKFIESLL